jgi:hypothetical protein
MYIDPENRNGGGEGDNFDYKADLQKQFREILGSDYNDKSIAEKMTNRNIRRDRLIERMKDILLQEFSAADANNDNRISLEEMQEYVKKSNRSGGGKSNILYNFADYSYT